MRIISHKKLKDFYELADSPHGAERHLNAWYEIVLGERWHNFSELRGRFQSADGVGDCIVFDVWNNRLRLIARVRYVTDDNPGGRVYILAVMTHAQYDENTWPDECGCHTKPPEKKARPVKKARKKNKKK